MSKLIEVSLNIGFVECKSWINYPAYGIWERKGPGEDGKKEVYVTGHRSNWDQLYRAEYTHNPDNLPQTKIVLEPERARYIGTL